NYALAADIELVLHGVSIACVPIGGRRVGWRHRLAWLHLPALARGGLVASLGWICRLPPRESHWRTMAGQTPFDGGFIQHYLWPLIYPPGLTREMQVALALCLIAGNVAVYLTVWRRRRRHC